MSQSAPKLPPAEAGASAESAPSKKRVLVVDDFDDAREMYAEYLEFAGFQVETARNGAEAVEKAQVAEPDIILMDLSLPVMDGWEATRLIKGDSRHPRHPRDGPQRPRARRQREPGQGRRR